MTTTRRKAPDASLDILAIGQSGWHCVGLGGCALGGRLLPRSRATLGSPATDAFCLSGLLSSLLERFARGLESILLALPLLEEIPLRSLGGISRRSALFL